MGSMLSTVRDQLDLSGEEKSKMEEQLNILEKMVISQLKEKRTQIIAGQRHDQEIHVGTIVHEHREVFIQLEQNADKTITGVGDALKSFVHGDFIDGLEEIVKVGAGIVLGNTSMGEHETSDMLIVWTNNSLLRVDVYYYRWNFSSHDIINNTQGVLGVLAVKRVIDLTETDPQVLVWAISRLAARTDEPDRASKLIDEAVKIMQKVKLMQRTVKGEGSDLPSKL